MLSNCLEIFLEFFIQLCSSVGWLYIIARFETELVYTYFHHFLFCRRAVNASSLPIRPEREMIKGVQSDAQSHQHCLRRCALQCGYNSRYCGYYSIIFHLSYLLVCQIGIPNTYIFLLLSLYFVRSPAKVLYLGKQRHLDIFLIAKGEKQADWQFCSI